MLATAAACAAAYLIGSGAIFRCQLRQGLLHVPVAAAVTALVLAHQQSCCLGCKDKQKGIEVVVGTVQ